MVRCSCSNQSVHQVVKKAVVRMRVRTRVLRFLRREPPHGADESVARSLTGWLTPSGMRGTGSPEPRSLR
jgi:hypothetical protein